MKNWKPYVGIGIGTVVLSLFLQLGLIMWQDHTNINAVVRLIMSGQIEVKPLQNIPGK